jgi:ribose/xylose/arabinose/galactoside ABC-type transport system permease subunit
VNDFTLRVRRFVASEAGRAALALLLVIAIGCAMNGGGAFFRWSTSRSMLREISVDGILACGMTLVIVAGGIDLSVGSGVRARPREDDRLGQEGHERDGR